ncbi:MAG TPA: R3H domain-containing nucleic acid-binding protein [Patescibacteria group bacterium]|nr:R3H domain-containing nucleic acid-binding protein [Patescibacteria group bacterium]
MAKKKVDSKEKIKEVLKLLEIDGDFDVKENEEGFDVILETPDSGIVIGHHGDTLEALQIILSLVLSKAFGEYKRVSIEIGDYKKNRSEYLERLAMETKERAVAENKEVYLPELKSWERRIVHIILQDDPDVTSESVGEGKDRTLVVKPKS